MNETSVFYSGEVDIKLRIKDKTFSFKSHNEGLPGLFESFARIMSGNYRGVCDIPQYIDLRKKVTGSEEYTTYLVINNVPLTGSSWEYTANSEFVANFTATLTSDMLFQVVSEDSTDEFMLYLSTITEDGLGRRDLARLPITAQSLAKIVPGVSAIIQWTMKLVNVS